MSVTQAFIDPFSDYGEVDADLTTINEWAAANGVQKVEGRYRIADIALARSKVGLPKFNVVARALSGTAAENGADQPQPPANPAPPRLVARTEPAAQARADGAERPIAATEDELLDLVGNHQGTITGMVTPELATVLLTLNTNNRPMSPRAIDRFQAILRRGAWQNTGEAIIVANNGQLSDGQHRLTAIRRTGISALCDVRFGIARAAFAVTGTGARRTTGSAMAIAGKPNATMQAAIGRLLVQHDAGYINRANIQVDSDLVIAIADTEPAIGNVAALIRSLKFKPTRTAPFGFALVLARRATSLDRVAAFANLVDSGKADEECGTRRLHVRLRDAGMNKERVPQIDVAVLTVRAWNAWIEGRAISRLVVSETDRTAEGFPKAAGGA
jgi:hypothetical protein